MARRRSGRSRGGAVARSLTPGRRSTAAGTRSASTLPCSVAEGLAPCVCTLTATATASSTARQAPPNPMIGMSEPEEELRRRQRQFAHAPPIAPVDLDRHADDQVPLEIVAATHLEPRHRGVPFIDARRSPDAIECQVLGACRDIHAGKDGVPAVETDGERAQRAVE